MDRPQLRQVLAALCRGPALLPGRRGPISLVEATPAGFRLHGRFKQPDRSNREAWPHLVIANGMMYVRDQDVLLCYDVRAK